MRVDDIFPVELMRNYYLNTFEKEIGDNYVIPTIMFYGPSVEMDYWHPKCDLEDTANIRFSSYDTDIHEKLKDNHFTIVKYEDVMAKAQKAMEEKPKKTASKKSTAPKPKKVAEGVDSGQPAVPRGNDMPSSDAIIGQPCPLCGKGHIIKGKTAYGCSEWRNGCTYRKPF